MVCLRDAAASWFARIADLAAAARRRVPWRKSFLTIHRRPIADHAVLQLVLRNSSRTLMASFVATFLSLPSTRIARVSVCSERAAPRLPAGRRPRA